MDSGFEGGSYSGGSQAAVTDTAPVAVESSGTLVDFSESTSIPEQESSVITGEIVGSVSRTESFDEEILSHVQSDGIESTLEALANGDYREESSQRVNEEHENQDTIVEEPKEVEEATTSASSEINNENQDEQIHEIPDEVRNDPEFQKTLGKLLNDKLQNGEEIDHNQLMQEAYQEFQQQMTEEQIEGEDLLSEIDALNQELEQFRAEFGEQLADIDAALEEMFEYLGRLVEMVTRLREILRKLTEQYEEEKKKRGENDPFVQELAELMSRVAIFIVMLFGGNDKKQQ